MDRVSQAPLRASHRAAGGALTRGREQPACQAPSFTARVGRSAARWRLRRGNAVPIVERSAGALQALIQLKQCGVAAAQHRLVEAAAELARAAESLATVERGRDDAETALAARVTAAREPPRSAAALVAEQCYRERLERELQGWADRAVVAGRECAAARSREEQAQRALAAAQSELRAFERHRERQERAARRRLELIDERRLDDLRVRAGDSAAQRKRVPTGR